MLLLAYVVAFVALVSLLAVATSRFVGRAMGRRVDESMRAAEHIVRTRHAPSAWVDRRAAAGHSPERVRGALVRRLEQVISTLKAAPVFEDAHARAVFLGELGRTRADWLTKPLGSIVGPETQSGALPPA